MPCALFLFYSGDNMKNIVKELIRLSDIARSNDDVPISSIIVKNNKIIAKAYNKRVKNIDPFAHAEILCIKKAAKKLGTYNLSDCELYSLLYPCSMCREVIKEAKIKKVYYILDNDKIINRKVKYIKMNNIDSNNYKKISQKISDFFKNKR